MFGNCLSVLATWHQCKRNSMELNPFLNWVQFTSVDLNRAARPDQREPTRQQQLTFSIKLRKDGENSRVVDRTWMTSGTFFLELWSPSQVSEVQTVLRGNQICSAEVLLAFSLGVSGVAPSVLSAIVISDSLFLRWGGAQVCSLFTRGCVLMKPWPCLCNPVLSTFNMFPPALTFCGGWKQTLTHVKILNLLTLI